VYNVSESISSAVRIGDAVAVESEDVSSHSVAPGAYRRPLGAIVIGGTIGFWQGE
jgi:hypothetical protein